MNKFRIWKARYSNMWWIELPNGKVESRNTFNECINLMRTVAA